MNTKKLSFKTGHIHVWGGKHKPRQKLLADRRLQMPVLGWNPFVLRLQKASWSLIPTSVHKGGGGEAFPMSRVRI